MSRHARLAAALLAAVVVAGLAALPADPTLPAGAQTTGGGELGPSSVRAHAADLGAGTFAGPGLPAVSPGVDSPYTWSREASSTRCVVFAGPVPPELAGSVAPLTDPSSLPFATVQLTGVWGAPPEAVRVAADAQLPADAQVLGDLVFDVAAPRDAAATALIVPRCAVPGEPAPATPPTAAAIWQETPLPRARLRSSPPGTVSWPGVVNLESRFWGDALTEARARVVLDDYVVEVVAHPIAYGWTFDDGTTTVTATPGSATEPVRATFRRRGDHPVRLHVVWAGTAHVVAPVFGLDLGVQDLGTVALPETAVHHVAEIRALLRSRSTRR